MAEASRDASRFAFVDVEVGNDEKIHDIGATRWDGATFHAVNREGLVEFLRDVDFVCGHNIVHHDIRYLFGNEELNMPWVVVDTLYMSPLLFPERPYHHLLKDDKLDTEQMNNPVNDCLKARDLLFDEIAQWAALSDDKKMIYAALLGDKPEFMGFLTMVGAPKQDTEDVANLIGETYRGLICEHAQWDNILNERPVALAYALALVGTTQRNSTTPPWVLHTYPEVEGVIYQLRHVRCQQGCEYCNRYLDVNQNLKRFFGYDGFRTYDDEPLQESAVRAAVEGQSLLAIFPTGGGKSLTFQLPALMASESVRGLTVVISPLQSLMKDQVDNLAQKGIADAVTINGLLDPISRSVAIERVMNGDASLLYIAPEMLRSNTIERLLLARNV
ncbi:MAG: DEAD/DEAH box helicase, partial [Bacteroidales bacterium]|nr:DEAD/DEAH box helicase [Bacteroidales bacterium]